MGRGRTAKLLLRADGTELSGRACGVGSEWVPKAGSGWSVSWLVGGWSVLDGWTHVGAGGQVGVSVPGGWLGAINSLHGPALPLLPGSVDVPDVNHPVEAAVDALAAAAERHRVGRMHLVQMVVCAVPLGRPMDGPTATPATPRHATPRHATPR